MRGVTRRDARIYAMRSIYAAIVGNDSADVQAEKIGNLKSLKAAKPSAIATDKLVLSILNAFDFRRQDILAWISEYYSRPIVLISAVEHAITATAIAEMLAHPDFPKNIIIDEALEITHLYGNDKGHEVVNGILEKVRQQLAHA